MCSCKSISRHVKPCNGIPHFTRIGLCHNRAWLDRDWHTQYLHLLWLQAWYVLTFAYCSGSRWKVVIRATMDLLSRNLAVSFQQIKDTIDSEVFKQTNDKAKITFLSACLSEHEKLHESIRRASINSQGGVFDSSIVTNVFNSTSRHQLLQAVTVRNVFRGVLLSVTHAQLSMRLLIDGNEYRDSTISLLIHQWMAHPHWPFNQTRLHCVRLQDIDSSSSQAHHDKHPSHNVAHQRTAVVQMHKRSDAVPGSILNLDVRCVN